LKPVYTEPGKERCNFQTENWIWKLHEQTISYPRLPGHCLLSFSVLLCSCTWQLLGRGQLLAFKNSLNIMVLNCKLRIQLIWNFIFQTVECSELHSNSECWIQCWSSRIIPKIKDWIFISEKFGIHVKSHCPEQSPFWMLLL